MSLAVVNQINALRTQRDKAIEENHGEAVVQAYNDRITALEAQLGDFGSDHPVLAEVRNLRAELQDMKRTFMIQLTKILKGSPDAPASAQLAVPSLPHGVSVTPVYHFDGKEYTVVEGSTGSVLAFALATKTLREHYPSNSEYSKLLRVMVKNSDVTIVKDARGTQHPVISVATHHAKRIRTGANRSNGLLKSHHDLKYNRAVFDAKAKLLLIHTT